MARQIDQAAATQAKELSIKDLAVTSLPPSIGTLAGLQKLVLENNRELVRLPDNITDLRGLQELQVIDSPLHTLPLNIGDCSSLTSLSVSGGTYGKLPPSFIKLVKLKTLQITDSRASQDGKWRGLEVLPDFATLKSLVNVDISNHPRLAAAPDGLGGLYRLKELKLSGCPRLTQLPDLKDLKRLRTLDLSGNTGLLKLPDIKGLTELRQIRLAGCEKLQSPLNQLNPRHLRHLEVLDLSGCTAMQGQFAFGLLEQIRDRVPLDCRIILHPRQREWNDQLAPFADEAGAHRLLQWTEAACCQGLSERAARKMDDIVAAAVASEPFRSKLVAFACENIILQRDNEGMTMADVAPRTYQGANRAHDLLVEHQVAEPDRAEVEARRILIEAVRDRCLHPHGGAGALRWLAGQEPLPPGERGHRDPPWPALAAYVQAHDPQAREIITRDDDLMTQLLPDERGRKPFNEGEMLKIVETMKNSHQVELHGRHVDVARALLSQLHEGDSSNQGRRNRWGLARWW